MKNKIKAVIFDMDGVLIDAKEWHFLALNKALSLFGLEISRYDHFVTFDGLPTKKKLKMLTLEKKLPEGLHLFINEMKQQYTMDFVYTQCKPSFYHQYALEKLSQDGIKLAVCSNSIKNTITTMLDKAKLLKYFDFYLSNQDVINGKPDPEIYLKAIEKLGLEPSECLIVEDNEHGLQAAFSSGANVLKIDDITEVNYINISTRILKIQQNA